jgi:hypothetical protein
MAIAGQASGQSQGEGAIHLGVASCAGNNCHGATERSQGSSVAQNEFLIWSKSDRHHRAYAVLLEARAAGIARNLGLPNAATADVCLGCHTDYVLPDRRGPRFQISDGVGCEACHGGASTWLGVHISGARHTDNLAAGALPHRTACGACRKVPVLPFRRSRRRQSIRHAPHHGRRPSAHGV